MDDHRHHGHHVPQSTAVGATSTDATSAQHAKTESAGETGVPPYLAPAADSGIETNASGYAVEKKEGAAGGPSAGEPSSAPKDDAAKSAEVCSSSDAKRGLQLKLTA